MPPPPPGMQHANDMHQDPNMMGPAYPGGPMLSGNMGEFGDLDMNMMAYGFGDEFVAMGFGVGMGMGLEGGPQGGWAF